jgi:hypothetical protein
MSKTLLRLIIVGEVSYFPPMKCFYSFLRNGLLIDKSAEVEHFSPLLHLSCAKCFAFGGGVGLDIFLWSWQK